MARPAITSIDQFTSPELANAAGLSSRNIKLLETKGLLLNDGTSVGKGASRVYDIEHIKYMAGIGALYKAGVEITLAANLMFEIHDEFSAGYGKIFSQVQHFLQKPFNKNAPYFSWGEEITVTESIDDDFWCHFYVRKYTNLIPGQFVLDGDITLTIVDREYVFIEPFLSEDPEGLNPPKYRRPEHDCFARIEGWSRASQTKVSPLVAMAGNISTVAGRAKLKDLETEFLEARKHAVGFIRINLSLAMRKALDNIYQARASKSLKYGDGEGVL